MSRKERERQIDSFFVELEKLYKKYNISLSHEDHHGAFELENYDEENLKWVKCAKKWWQMDQDIKEKVKNEQR